MNHADPPGDGWEAVLAAVPGRRRFLTAKAVLFTVVALVSGIMTSVVSFYVGDWVAHVVTCS